MHDPTPEHRLLVETVSDIAADFDRVSHEWDGEPPLANLATLADHGFVGLNLPKAYGGAGMSETAAILAVEAVGTVCPPTAELLMNSSLVAPRAIELFGTPAAKETYLPPITSGDTFLAIAMSEPEAGSDLQTMSTAVEETNDGTLVLNGEKTWVGMVEEAVAAVVWARFPEGLGTLILELDQPGVEVQSHFTNMAGHRQTQFVIDDVEVPEENVLTRGESAFQKQLGSLNWERVGAAAFATAVGRKALRTALEYAGDRTQFGQTIGEFQGIRWKLSEMVTSLEMSRALTYRAAARADDDGHPDPLEAGMAKLAATRSADNIVDEALQIHGANGYMQGHPLEYLYRYIRGYRIAGGTDEIQRNTIARLLERDGLPPLL